MPVLERDGQRLHYRAEGKGPAVLLLHGFPFSSAGFLSQLPALATRYRVIVPDHRGFGESPPSKVPTSMELYAEDALAILDHEGISSAFVGGVSMGGYIAMALLRRSAMRVSGLGLFDTMADADDDERRAGREKTAREVEAKGMGVLVETMLPKLFPDPSSEVAKETAALMLRNPREGAAAALRAMATRPDSKELLSRYSGPALVVVGEKDAITPPAKAEAMSNLIPGSTLEVLPSLGHLCHQERPDLFNGVLLKFLQRG